MKKIFMFLAVMGVMAFSAQNVAAQDETAEPTATEEIARGRYYRRYRCTRDHAHPAGLRQRDRSPYVHFCEPL